MATVHRLTTAFHSSGYSVAHHVRTSIGAPTVRLLGIRILCSRRAALGVTRTNLVAFSSLLEIGCMAPR